MDFNLLRNDPELNFCMTHLRAHELDINKGDKVLFPVRHPFNVLYSSLNWLKKKHGLDVSEKDLLLSDSSIFCQETQWNYRDYMNSWSPILLNSRLQVLILKYEDRSRVFKKEINKISNFLNVEPKNFNRLELNTVISIAQEAKEELYTRYYQYSLGEKNKIDELSEDFKRKFNLQMRDYYILFNYNSV